MATTAQTTDSLAISRIIYYTDNTANGVDQNPPFIPVNAPGVPGAGISYGGRPAGNQTITAAGQGYTAGVANTKLIGRPADANGSQAANNVTTPLIGQGLQVTLTVGAGGNVTQATPVANTGNGYITGMQVEVLGNAADAEPCILTIVGAAANNQALIDANKEAQLEQCQNLYPFNATEGIAYSEVANGSNVVGIADLTITAVTAADGTVTAAGANQGRQFWNENQTLTFQANIVNSPAGNGADANRTITWSATGAGLTNNIGSAVAGQALQRSFAVPDSLAATETDNLVITCTITYTDAAGAVATESFLIQGT
jgi:hypothetical protein